jgi:hypothetical protein
MDSNPSSEPRDNYDRASTNRLKLHFTARAMQFGVNGRA